MRSRLSRDRVMLRMVRLLPLGGLVVRGLGSLSLPGLPGPAPPARAHIHISAGGGRGKSWPGFRACEGRRNVLTSDLDRRLVCV